MILDFDEHAAAHTLRQLSLQKNRQIYMHQM
jgi:hypothetical protein